MLEGTGKLPFLSVDVLKKILANLSCIFYPDSSLQCQFSNQNTIWLLTHSSSISVNWLDSRSDSYHALWVVTGDSWQARHRLVTYDSRLKKSCDQHSDLNWSNPDQQNLATNSSRLFSLKYRCVIIIGSVHVDWINSNRPSLCFQLKT